MLPASIQVCPVEIPGRGRREGEPAPESIASLAMLLAKSLPLDVSPRRRPSSHLQHPELHYSTRTPFMSSWAFMLPSCVLLSPFIKVVCVVNLRLKAHPFN